MRVYDIICEAIPQPVRNLKVYAQNRLKEATRLEQIAARLLELEKSLSSRPSDDIRSYLIDIGVDNNEAWEALSEVESLARRAGSQYSGFSLDTITTNMRWILDMLNEPDSGGQNTQYILKAIGYTASHLGQETNVNFDFIIRLANKIDQIVKGMTEQGYMDPKYAEPEDIQEYQAWFEAIKLAGQFAVIWQRMVATKEKLDNLLSMRDQMSFQQKPKTDEQETLYHASAWAAEIAEEGFQAEAPTSDDRKGLGTYGSTANVVSFTHDIHTARNIARSLKELIMIANGKIRKHNILRWLKDEGMDMSEIDRLAGSNIMAKPDSPKTTAKLYHVWLYMNKIGRENPVFTNIEETVKMYQGRSVDDVGIIASTVNMQDEEISYQPAEKEWRVPPQAILNAKRIQ